MVQNLCKMTSWCKAGRSLSKWTFSRQVLKNEPLEVTYSYFDGSGHRRLITVKQGDTIGDFLKAVREQLAPDFKDIRSAALWPLSHSLTC